MAKPEENWAPRPTLNRRFWVGCVVMLFSISLLIATFLTYARTPDAELAWEQMLFAGLITGVGAYFALSQGNLAALKARLT